MLEAVWASVTIDAAVGSIELPEGVFDEVTLAAGVGAFSVSGVEVYELCGVVVESEVVDFEASLAPRASSPQRATTRTAAVIPIISPKRFLRGGVTGGAGNGCA